MSSARSKLIAAGVALLGIAASACSSTKGTTSPGSGGASLGRIAFVSKAGGMNQIYLMSIDSAGFGATPARLTADSDPENYPTWSPDGTRLVYQRDFNGAAIYVIKADGTGSTRLSPTPGMDITPSWSPDGTKIVFVRLLAPPAPNVVPPSEMHVMNADGTGDHVILANAGLSIEPRWSSRNQLVFMSLMNGPTYDVYTMQPDGTGLQRLTHGANNGDPVWSPDGNTIVFGSDREGNNRLNVFSMRADGSQVTQLTHFDVPYESGDTNFSHDGLRIAFEYDIDGKKQSDPNVPAEVWIMNADGSGAHTTRVACSSVGCAPRWQPTR
jgi:Tol biopolymer transport system component